MTGRHQTAALAAIVFAGVLAVYASTLRAGVSVGDAAEAETVPYILGIPHATGFPAYVLAGWLFSHAVPFETVAWRLGLFTALCTAAGAAGVFLLAVTIGSRAPAAVLAALAFAFAAPVWLGAVDPNAQIVSEMFSVYAVVASVRYARSGDPWTFIAACLCCGLGMAAHPASIWVLPGIAVALAWRFRDISVRPVAFGTAALVLPLLLYAYLPIRSAVVVAHGLDPNAAAPLYGAGGFDWNTNDPSTASGFLDELSGRSSKAGKFAAQALDPRAFFAAVPWWITYAQRQYSLGLLLLGAGGAALLAWLDRRAFSIVAVVAGASISFASVYYRDTHVDRYLFVSFALIAALAAVCSRLSPTPRFGSAVNVAATLALAIILIAGLVQNRPVLPSQHYPDGEAIIGAVIHATPDNAIVVAQWNDAAALGYGAFVERSLGARTVVAAWPADYSDRYEGWALARPVFLLVSPIAAARFYPMLARLRPTTVALPRYQAFEVVP